MWVQLESHLASLEKVFDPLRVEAEKYDRAWSIAELRLKEKDVKWLKSWIGYLTPESVENWIQPIRFGGPRETFVTRRQMFGALLICASAEICREESREGSVWPAIRNILPGSNALRGELFLSNGQPSPLTKDIISDTVRALNLRHVMDIEGTQQWFTTIKLQFGFTYKGANNRLAEWLVNLGQPNAIQYLSGESEFSEITSESFQTLWKSLQQYRRGLITEIEVRSTIQQNPWIKAHWIDNLLIESKARITTLGIGEEHLGETILEWDETEPEELCPISNISLEWPQGAAPRFKFQLDSQSIEEEISWTDVSELDFYVDGKKLCRWLRQPDGSWAGEKQIYAEPDKAKEHPNLNARILSIQSGSGNTLDEWDFVDSGLLEDVLIFDLEKEELVKAGEEQLDPNRRYALLCDRNYEIEGCIPIDTFKGTGISRKVMRLPVPLNGNITVVFGDFVLWHPIKEEKSKRPSYSLVVTTPSKKIFSLNDRSKLLIDGLPEDADAVQLLIHKKFYEVQRENGNWRTIKKVTLTPELAARQDKPRVHFKSGGRTFTFIPRLDFNLLGAAMLQHNRESSDETIRLEPLGDKENINRAEGTTNLRIWTPGNNNRASVFEQNIRVGNLRYNKIRLKEIPGHGGELHVQSDGNRFPLNVRCIDSGVVGKFVPGMLGTDAQLLLLSDKEPAEVGESGYAVYIWFVNEKGKVTLHKVSNESILTDSSNRLWKIRNSRNPMAVALTWKGSWLGAWWDLERIRNYLSSQTVLTEREFTLLKWLRIPLLHPELTTEAKKVILEDPSNFVKSWLHDADFPKGIRPHTSILRPDSVIRHYLWNDFPVNHTKNIITILTKNDSKWYTNEDRCITYLEKQSDISPILFWRGLETCLEYNQGNIIRFLKLFTHRQLHLDFNASKHKVNYRLKGLENRVIKATGIDEDRLEDISNRRIAYLNQNGWLPKRQDRSALLKIGEAESGRRYLSAKIGNYWIGISNKGHKKRVKSKAQPEHKIQIKLKSYDHNLIDKSTEKIIQTLKSTGAEFSGPIPLPVKKTNITVNHSVNESEKSRKKYEYRSHKRLIDILSPGSQTVEALMELELPSGVDIEIKT